ncbi:MAG TPA: PAS domain-containing protein [Alphaproteobacteria bacterium]|nr:PAS domain-containing protein [Alphaproteobacteria bacterium]
MSPAQGASSERLEDGSWIFHWDRPPPTPLLRSVLAYWDSRRGAKPMPARADLDPLHIPNLLPRIMLFDVLRDPLDFRYRLIGTGVCERLERDTTGLKMSDLPQKSAPSAVFRFAAAICAERRPGWTRLPYIGPDRFIRYAVSVGAPLASDGETVDMLFYGVDFVAGDPHAEA